MAPSDRDCASKESVSPDCGPTLAFLLLRLWLGMRALLTGIEKFSENVSAKVPIVNDQGVADIPNALTVSRVKEYGLQHYAAVKGSMAKLLETEPLLPTFLRKPYFASLGFVLIALGLMLLLGVCTRTTLFLMGLLYISLTYGMILLGQDSGIAWLGIHVALVAMALMLVKHNRFSLTRRF